MPITCIHIHTDMYIVIYSSTVFHMYIIHLTCSLKSANGKNCLKNPMMQQLLPVDLDCVVMATGEARHCGGGVEGRPGG